MDFVLNRHATSNKQLVWMPLFLPPIDLGGEQEPQHGLLITLNSLFADICRRTRLPALGMQHAQEFSHRVWEAVEDVRRMPEQFLELYEPSIFLRSIRAPSGAMLEVDPDTMANTQEPCIYYTSARDPLDQLWLQRAFCSWAGLAKQILGWR